MKRTYLEIILVFAMVIVGYGYFFSGTDWNTNSRLALVRAIVDESRYEIDNFYERGVLRTRDVARYHGHFYSDKAIGSSSIGAAFYRLTVTVYYRILHEKITFRMFIELMTFLAVSLISAFLAPIIYSFSKNISGSSAFSLLITAIICLGTPFYKYATMYYGHTLSGVFLFIAFFLWYHIKQQEKINRLKVFIAGYFLSYSIITEYPTVFIAACVLLYALFVLWKKSVLFDIKTYLALGIGLAIPILVALTYNAGVFGSPFTTGYSYEIVQTFVDGQNSGFMGIGLPNLSTLYQMTFDTQMGVFLQAPVLLMAFWGWFQMWRNNHHRAEAIFSFATVLLYFLLMSGYYMWWGGAAFTPRSLIPVFPFFAIPFVFFTQKWEKILTFVLAIPSLLQMFIVTAAAGYGVNGITDNILLKFLESTSAFNQPSVIYQVYVPNFLDKVLVMNRGKEFFHLTGYNSLIPFFLVEAVLLIAFFISMIRPKSKTND